VKIADYRTLVFDCDGVILNSNGIKTEAFHTVAMPYGESAVAELVSYHVLNGSISRLRKFEYLLSNIVPSKQGPAIAELLSGYAIYVRQRLLT